MDKEINTIDDLKVLRKVVCQFSQTTPSFMRDTLTALHCQQVEWTNYYFVSFNLSTNHSIKCDGKKRAYQTLKQIQQYNFLSRKLLQADFFTLSSCMIMFEQTLQGIIHFHCIVSLKESVHMHDFKCELYDLFEITNRDELKYTCQSSPITDYVGMVDYFFKETKKRYELLDCRLFKPLILNNISEDVVDFVSDTFCAEVNYSIANRIVKIPEEKKKKKTLCKSISELIL